MFASAEKGRLNLQRRPTDQRGLSIQPSAHHLAQFTHSGKDTTIYHYDEGILIISRVRPITCVCHAANCLARYVCIQARGKYGEGGELNRLEDNNPTMISALALVIQPTNRPWTRKKSQDGVDNVEAKISMGEAPQVCQLLSSSLANFGRTNNPLNGSTSFT